MIMMMKESLDKSIRTNNFDLKHGLLKSSSKMIQVSIALCNWDFDNKYNVYAISKRRPGLATRSDHSSFQIFKF